MKHTILCTVGNAFAPEGKKILERIGEVTYATPTQEEFAAMVADVTILVVQLGLTVDRTVIDAAPRLRWIVTATTGLDHIDAAYAESKNIRILSLRGETAFLRTVTATAELACGLMIALVRRIPAAHASVAGGRWDRAAFVGHSLTGKTLGIVGRGRLGEMMAAYGAALGMHVVFTDPAVPGGISLEELLRAADVVTLHVHPAPETEGMINARTLALMKPTAVLVNTARSVLVDEAAIIKALEEKKLAGYAADVLEDERSFTPERASSRMIDYARSHDNLILTPHIGGTTVEARSATDVFMAQKLHDALRNAP